MKTSLTIETPELDIPVSITYSKRKALSIYVRPDLTVQVKAPLRIRSSIITSFIEEKRDWIIEKYLYFLSHPPTPAKQYSEEEEKQLRKKARVIFTEKAEYYSKILNVSYGRIAIRAQKTCWGSCSSKKNLNFNWKLIGMPDPIIDYVVVHEVAHLIEMNHSKNFWLIVESIIPDYKEKRSWLKEHGNEYL